MSRTMPMAFKTALAAPIIRPFFAVELFFTSGTLRLWTGQGTQTFDGSIYIGGGDFLGVDGVSETSDMASSALTISLAGQNGALVALALAEPFQNRLARLHMGLFTNAEMTTYSMIELTSGYMDRMPISDNAEAATVSVVVENRLNELGNASNMRYTQESQQARFPGDNFFSALTDLQDKDIPWGRTAAT
jgi:hypothetical protein